MKQLIFVIDDEAVVREMICDLVARMIPTARCNAYHGIHGLLEDPDLNDADLFIVDMALEGIDGRELPNMLPDSLRQVPILFISGIFHDDDLAGLPPDIFFDFAPKPTPVRLLANRINLLLRVSRHNRAQFQAAGSGYWRMIYHAPFLAVVLQDDMKIRACNLKLAKTVGYEDPEELVGKSWFDFLSIQNREVVAQVHRNVLCGEFEDFGEIENEILDTDGNPILIKWFNSYLENERITLSIGIPPKKLLMLREDDIRAYWYNVIVRDRKAILAMQSAFKIKGRVVANDDTC